MMIPACALLLLTTTCLFGQYDFIEIGGCAPTGDESCDVSYIGYSGSIGCQCNGVCTNNRRIGVDPIVSWSCQQQQSAHGNASAYEGNIRTAGFGDIWGPGSPAYESRTEREYCDYPWGEYYGSISGVCCLSMARIPRR